MLQMKDASERMGEALRGRAMRPTATQTATFGPYDESGPLPCIQGEGLRAAEARGFEPRKGANPNRISSAAP